MANERLASLAWHSAHVAVVTAVLAAPHLEVAKSILIALTLVGWLWSWRHRRSPGDGAS